MVDIAVSVNILSFPQGRQSAKLFSSRRKWDSTTPLPPAVPGEGGTRGGTLACGRGGGGVPIPTRGQTLYSRYVCTSPLWMNRCVNTKDGTLQSALLY